MRWTKILIAVMAALLTYVTHPVETFVVNYYKLRWFVSSDSSQRTATVAIRNSGDKSSDPISVSVKNSSGEVTDLEYAVPRFGSHFSYLNMAMHSEPFRQFSASPTNRILLDEHIHDSSLKGLEEGLEDAILATTVPHSLDLPVARAQMTLANHLSWLQQCADPRVSRHPCCLERAWEKWEYMLRGVQAEVNSNWKRDAGFQLIFPDFHLVPAINTRFLSSLQAGESVLFVMHVGPGAFQSTFSASPKPFPVRKIEDLDAGYLKMCILYPAVGPILGVALTLAVLIPVGITLVPPKYLHSYVLVNLALTKRDQMDTAAQWEEVYSRTKYFLKERFEYYRWRLSRPPGDLSSEQLFDYLRAELRLRYGGSSTPFANAHEFADAVQRCLLELALN